MWATWDNGEWTARTTCRSTTRWLRGVFDQSARRISETKTATDGFAQNRTDIRPDAVRLQANVKFNAKNSLSLSYDETTNKATGPNYYDLTANGIPTKLVDSRVDGQIDAVASGFKAEFKSDLGFANLNYLFGHRTTDNREDYSTGPLILLTNSESKQDSHELRLSSSDAKAPLQWVAGLFQFKETGGGQLVGQLRSSSSAPRPVLSARPGVVASRRATRVCNSSIRS